MPSTVAYAKPVGVLPLPLAHPQAYLALVGADPSTYLLQLNEDNQLAGLLPYQVSVVPGRKELVIAIR